MPLQEVTTPPAPAPILAGTVTAKSSPEEKVKLFLELFRGREDVYAVRWEGRDGKAGYSPACRRVWGKSFPKHAEKPRDYFPLTTQIIHDHLMGKLTAGVYPLLADETCWFLAADFDKATWQEDVRAYLQKCSEWQVPALLERRRFRIRYFSGLPPRAPGLIAGRGEAGGGGVLDQRPKIFFGWPLGGGFFNKYFTCVTLCAAC